MSPDMSRDLRQASSWETVIGLEVHVEMNTRTKIFCGCPTTFGTPPNTQVCPICLGLPGTLPVLNQEALERALMVGLALDCRIAPRFKFDRKHYYYPDLPKNFQISQYDLPLAEHGSLKLSGGTAVRIKRVHLEEDAGKLIHEGVGGQIGGGEAALVDYNRSGMPLLEIVSEPDLANEGNAVEYLKAIQTLVRYLRVSDGNMDEGSLRCDANISVRKAGTKELGAKIEIKNMNSFKSVERALVHEAARQREALEAGQTLPQETRLFDEDSGTTRSMRGKEGAHDYRYFPEPDLPLFTATPELLERLRTRIPELPAARRLRYVQTHGLPDYDAGVLTADRDTADYYETALRAGAPAKTASNWIMTELLGALHGAGQRIADSKISPAELAALLKLIDQGTISGKIAKTVFAEMFRTGKPAATIVKDQGLVQISDESALHATVTEVLRAQPGSVADYKAGKQQAIGFLVGQVMKSTGGKANPQLVNKLLREELAKG